MQIRRLARHSHGMREYLAVNNAMKNRKTLSELEYQIG